MKSPNILVLMVDQLAPHYTGAYGHRIVQTPHMNRLAERGCRFDAAYTPYPQCAPARFSMLAGQLPWRIRAYDNAAEFSSAIPTVCHYLARIGYQSCLTGKMHFVGPDQLHGFSERLTTDIYPADYAFTPNWETADERNDDFYHNMSSVREAGHAEMTFQLEFDDETGFHGIRKLYDYARNPDSAPFFMVASFTHPHDPYVARSKWWDLYAEKEIDLPRINLDSASADPHTQRLISGMQADVDPPAECLIRQARQAYYANTSYVDDWLGQFIDTLEKTRLLEKTIVVFTADHGDMLGERGLWYKMCFFEQAARVPLIIAGPGIRSAAIPSVCSTVDLLPTLVELAADGAGTASDQLDGHSLCNLLTENGDCSDRTVVSQYSAECTSHPMVMLRRGPLKYIHCEIDPPMLFNLVDDPDELNNLAPQPSHQSIVKSFASEVHARWDLERTRQDIIADQQSRLLVQAAARHNPGVAWDYQPLKDAAQSYVRTHQNCDEMAQMARFPRFNP